MRLTVLRMLSTSSLQAFSGATTTAPVNRPEASSPIRLVRSPASQATRQAAPLPATPPAIPPPRGSLLNLSV